MLLEALQRESPRRFPAERLLMAVLEDAVRCYVNHAHAQTRQGQQLFRATREWLTRHDRTRLFTFESICDALDLDPDRIRAALCTWRRARGV